MRSQNRERGEGRDLVDELIGEESENEYTHKPDGTYKILNDVVVDRGPNPSRFIPKLPEISNIADGRLSHVGD